MGSLIDIVRDGFIKNVKNTSAEAWKVVIMDDSSKKLFVSVCQDFDLLSENVTAIEHLTAKRSAATSMIAIYFVAPLLGNADLILRDFSSSNPKYRSANVFFLSEPHPEVLSQLTSSPCAKYWGKIKTIHINFFPFESRVFTFRNPAAFFNVYSASAAKSKSELSTLAHRLVSICASLGENPVVRYQAMDSGLHTPQSLAIAFQAELDSFVLANPGFSQSKEKTSQGRGVMIILDRSVDLYAPLLHELTYQALVTDVLGLEEGKIYRHNFVNGLGNEVEEEVILDESDPIWSSLRHMHIADCIQELVKQFKMAVSDNPAAASMVKRSQNGQNASLSEMRDIVASVPELQELSKKYSAHMDLAGQCMDFLRTHNLDSAIDCEQNIVTGITSDGEPVKNVLNSMAPFLTEALLPLDDKLRLLMLYSLSRQGDYDRRRLESHAGLSDLDRSALTNLSYLASNRPTNKPKERPKFINPFRRTVKPKDEEDNPYALSRYIPQVKKIIMDQISKEITMEEFPLVKEDEAADIRNPVRSLRVNRPSWQKKVGEATKTSINKKQGGRILLFVVGGLTYSEIRSVYEISKALNREVVIGTTHIITPSDFIESLRQLQAQGPIQPSSPVTPPPKTNRRSYGIEGRRSPLPSTPDTNSPANANLDSLVPPPRSRGRSYTNGANLEEPASSPASMSGEASPSSTGKSFGFSKFLKFG